ARDKIYNAVPASLDTIHAPTDVPIRIFNREGQELYDGRSDARPPRAALNEAREARVRGPKVTRVLSEGWRDQHAVVPGAPRTNGHIMGALKWRSPDD